ncbi:MAG: DHA3 family macrolide efflux protein-like MFS transporter [Planctomycetota bacterium]|jgi:DHA3 family macrolide efflux protein-like MFS transporter
MKNKRAITFLFLANTVSGISQGISLIAIPWYISNTLSRPSLYAFMFLTATAISIPWGTFAGTLVDKYDRKKIMLAIQTAGFILISATAITGYIQNEDTLWMAMVVYFTTVALYNIHYPNQYAFAQEITEPRHYSRITSWLEIQGQTSFAIAGAVAAILLEGGVFGFHFEKWRIHEIFMLDASTYVLAIAFLSLIKYKPIAQRDLSTGSLFTKLKEGFGFLNSNRTIFLFGVVSAVVFAGILVTSMYILPILIKNYLNGTEKVFGISEATFAIGSLLSGLLIIKIFSKKHLVLGVMVLQFIAGIAFFFMGINQSILLLYFLYLIIGFTNAGIRIMRVTYLFNVVPNKFIGRANSIFSVISASLRIMLVLIVSQPFFTGSENIRYAMFIASFLIFVGAFTILFNFKRFKQLNTAA